MALFLNTARCAWGSGKKYIESGALGGKRSDTHKAAQVGREVVFPAANGLPFIGIGSTSHYVGWRNTHTHKKAVGVGKVEQQIIEDDLWNQAVMADLSVGLLRFASLSTKEGFSYYNLRYAIKAFSEWPQVI
ncbi:hypothetical protein ACOSQ3_021689 [Xanthoceras sorbifolium]